MNQEKDNVTGDTWGGDHLTRVTEIVAVQQCDESDHRTAIPFSLAIRIFASCNSGALISASFQISRNS